MSFDDRFRTHLDPAYAYRHLTLPHNIYDCMNWKGSRVIVNLTQGIKIHPLMEKVYFKISEIMLVFGKVIIL